MLKALTGGLILSTLAVGAIGAIAATVEPAMVWSPSYFFGGS